MQAARDLEQFVELSKYDLLGVEAVFARIAARRMPSVPMEQHKEAASIVHSLIHARMDETEERAEAGANEDELEEIADKYEDEIRKQIAALTGRIEDNYHYSRVWSRTAYSPPGARVLRSSLLMGIVSDFEVFIAALIRAQLAIRPEILRSSEQKYTFQDIDLFETLDEFREYCAERMAENLLRGGFEDWMEWFSNRHKVKIPGVTDTPVELMEIFQRRHLFVHNGGVVNDLYLAKVASLPELPDKGTQLRITGDYLVSSMDRLSVAAVALVAGVWLKLFPTRSAAEELDGLMTSVTYGLLQDGHYEAVRQISEWHQTFVLNDESRIVSMVNAWLSRRVLSGLESVRDEIEAWDTSTLAGRFKLVKLALLEQNEEAYALAKLLLGTDELSESSWHTWPILENVRLFAASEGDVDASAGYSVRHADPGPG